MAEDPHAVSGAEPAEPPADPGAEPTLPLSESGETAPSEEPDWKQVAIDAQESNRRLEARLGLLSQELSQRYQAPASTPEPAPNPQRGGGNFSFALPDEVVSAFQERYDISAEDLAALGQGIARQIIPHVGTVASQVAQYTVEARQQAHAFFETNKDLEPYRHDVQRVAQAFMQDPAKHRGRPLEQCLDEVASEARKLLLGKDAPTPAAMPASTGDPNRARPAPGGSAGGSEGKKTPPRPKGPALNSAERYAREKAMDQSRRSLGGTRLAREEHASSRTLSGVKVR